MTNALDVGTEFCGAIRAAGLDAPEAVEADGRLHRFASNGKRGDDAGWYVLFGDGIPAGAFGCWRSGIRGTWRADVGRRLTPEEEMAQRERIAKAKLDAEFERKRTANRAATRARQILFASTPASEDHLYLIAKRVKPHGARLYRGNLVIREMACDGALIVPARDTEGRLSTLEFIAPNGEKRFLPGGRKAGAYFAIGKPNGTICIAEGFATGASIHECAGYAVAVAFDAGNLKAVALFMRQKFPSARLIVCCDNDIEEKK
jgi:putative DNA primase/helicase